MSMLTVYRTNQSIWIINETQLSEERAAGSWCCGAQLRSTDGSGKRKYLLSHLESNPVLNTIHPGPLLTSLCVCAECEYYEALSIDTLNRALFRNIKRPPQNATFINWHDYRPRRTSYKTRKICLRNVEYQNDAVTSWARRSLFPKCHMISRCISKDNFTVARKVRPSLFRCSRNSQMLGTTACRSVMPNFNKSDNEHWM
jgi:hypothetical protein